MNNTAFNYNFQTEDNITRHIIYENSVFDINKVFSEQNKEHTSMTVITPSQQVSCSFEYRFSPGGHAGITDIILSRIYPNYKEIKIFGDQEIYANNGDINIFIITIKTFIAIFIPPNGINQTQYEYLYNYINSFKNSNYYKTGKQINLYINDEEYPFEKIENVIMTLKENIISIDIPTQYIIPKINFHNLNNEDEINRIIDLEYNNYNNSKHIKK